MTLQNMTEKLTAQMARFESQQEPKSVLSSEYEEFKSFVLCAITTLHCQIEMVAQEVEQQEMRSRRKMLLLHGVQEVDDEDPSDAVLELARNNLSLPDMVRENLCRVHRMGKASTDKPRPLLLEFRSADLRNQAWTAKTGLRNTGVTMSEFLTKRRHNVFVAARKRFGVTKCWTRDGIIIVLGPEGTRHRVTTAAELAVIPDPIRQSLDSHAVASASPVLESPAATSSPPAPAAPAPVHAAASQSGVISKQMKSQVANKKVLRSTMKKV